MGSCFSSATKVGGSSSGSAGHREPEAAQKKPREAQRKSSQHPRQQRDRHRRRPSGSVPYGKRTDFGYAKDFDSRYSIGKLLGHGQFGYTFVATDMANGDRVAVKRIDKNKVVLLAWIAFSFMERFELFFFVSICRVGEAEEGGEDVRVRGRARDVGDAAEDGFRDRAVSAGGGGDGG